MRFTLRHLEYFVAAANAKSISDAAERARISPASISTAVSHLEQEFDVKLFVRHHSQGIVLTPAGEQFAVRARALLELARGFYDDAAEFNTSLRGSLTVGCLVTLAPLVLPEVCHTFTVEHPEVSIEFVEGNQDQLISSLRREQCDLAITYDMHLSDDISFDCLVELPPCVLLPTSHKFAKRKSVQLSDVADEPYIMLDLPHSRDYFLSLFSQAGIEPEISARSTQPGVVRTMVANGYGVTITVVRPKNKAAADGKATVPVPLGGGVRLLPLGVIRLKRGNRSQLMTAFEEHLHGAINPKRVPGMTFGDPGQVNVL